ncbi:MAG: 30S ribosomal protein S17 [Thermodesulfobacteriota bacterium]|nr:30S ribosomal protein S17 [Thermodesulfobacteriota bacterium]
METQRLKRTLVGTVVSDKMDKTVVIESSRLVKHPVYKKRIRKRARFKAHDKDNQCKVGDKVLIVESRPLSKEKRWKVREILEERV